jgi:hypothetical protein
MFMAIHAQSSDSTRVDEFRHAHTIWKKANDSFHDRFQQIVTTGGSDDLDTLAADLASKFEHFIKCSKALVTGA